MHSGFRIDRRAALTGLGAALVAKPGAAQGAQVDVVVIGAGLSGLNAALLIKDGLAEQVDDQLRLPR